MAVIYTPVNPDGFAVGYTSADKVGFYGKTPVVRRTYASSLHESSAVVTSASFGASQVAIIQELVNTMRGLGIYATA